MSHNPQVLDALNRAMDALNELKRLLEAEEAEPAAPEAAEPAAQKPDPEPEQIVLIPPEKPESAPELKEPIELVEPEKTAAPQAEPILLEHPESAAAEVRRPIELELPEREEPVKPAEPKPLAMECPRCGKMVDHGFKFCMYCGESLQKAASPFTCSACGKQLRPGNRFCVYCGTPVK